MTKLCQNYYLFQNKGKKGQSINTVRQTVFILLQYTHSFSCEKNPGEQLQKAYILYTNKLYLQLALLLNI